MSTALKKPASAAANTHNDGEAIASAPKGAGHYKGFVAGVFSGLAKLSVGYYTPSTRDVHRQRY